MALDWNLEPKNIFSDLKNIEGEAVDSSVVNVSKDIVKTKKEDNYNDENNKFYDGRGYG